MQSATISYSLKTRLKTALILEKFFSTDGFMANIRTQDWLTVDKIGIV